VSPAERLPRVAVLGGGVGAVTAAFELSDGDWRQRFDSITIYQLGWRIGGKGASGRGEHDRIEEHGLHIWLGYYANAFRMMRQCYEELGRPPDAPLATVDEAFERASLFVLEERRPEGWRQWSDVFPEDDAAHPWDDDAGTTEPLEMWDYVKLSLRLAASFVDSVIPGPHRPRLRPPPRPTAPAAIEWLGSLWRLATTDPRGAARLAVVAAVEAVEELGDDVGTHGHADHGWLLGLIEHAAGAATRHLREETEESDTTRRSWYLIDVLLACAGGIVRGGLLFADDGFEAIDDYDFADWLVLNGAAEESAHSTLVTTVAYDLPFAFRDGDSGKPAASAGTALNDLFSLFFEYRGAIAWKMRAGMGDVVFAPLYQVLRRRGVTFEFFHRVDELVLDQSGRYVDRIHIGRQMDLAAGVAQYEPLVEVKGLECWPARPLVEQLQRGDQLGERDLESFWVEWEDAGRVTLQRGRDFDAVVLGISLGSVPFVCEQLVDASPAWRDMVKKVGTIQTQSFQLWLSEPVDQLVGEEWGRRATVGGYLEPFDTWADMSQLIDRESFDEVEPGVRAVAYFTNSMPTPVRIDRSDRTIPQRAHRQVKENALRFLRDDMVPLWPGGVRRYPTDFRWELLVGAPDDADGEERFDSQFWRANVDPSERYVLSLPGTTRYRLDPGASGFENLYLAGDWTRCLINAGCVEAAVISGLMAARAVRGAPGANHIIGYEQPGGP
jgi:uncharacterized protein with NAD-binding domain and iron-sulfur cluster